MLNDNARVAITRALVRLSGQVRCEDDARDYIFTVERLARDLADAYPDLDQRAFAESCDVHDIARHFLPHRIRR